MKRTIEKKNLHVTKGLNSIKRRHPRIEVHGFIGDIADGNFVLAGAVDDVSLDGFKMSNLPRNFSATTQNYTLVMSGKGNHYRLIVTPCWKDEIPETHSVVVGFRIVQAPWEWTEFILNKTAPGSSGEDYGYQA
jgi:hypothetical protein